MVLAAAIAVAIVTLAVGFLVIRIWSRGGPAPPPEQGADPLLAAGLINIAVGSALVATLGVLMLIQVVVGLALATVGGRRTRRSS